MYYAPSMFVGNARRYVAALIGYVAIALVFAWPLPLHLTDALPGSPGGDTGVYVWNLWLFRHEIVAHHQYPFFTADILSLGPPVPLALHNYTTFANLLAFPLLPIMGTVGTFNVLMIGSGVLSAFAMFLLARSVVHDDVAAWLAGVLFGFSPFMSARVAEHFSLVQAAPLPLFALVVRRIRRAPTLRLAAAAGALVGWAFLCDPYYAVYCLLVAAFVACYEIVTVEERRGSLIAWRFALLDIGLLCMAGLIAGILIGGGGRVDLLGVRVSIRGLYNPVLVFTLLALLRVWLTVRPKLAWALPSAVPSTRVLLAAAGVCAVVVAPVLYASGGSMGQRSWISPHVYWRSSPPGMDLLAFFTPNPLNPWVGASFAAPWAAHLPNGAMENIASVPWVAIATIAVAVFLFALRPPRGWVLFTALFGLMALGPFIRFAGHSTYLPTPWALLRYVPIIGAARMPGRLVVLLMLGVAILFAFAVRRLREAGSGTGAPVLVAALLLVEMSPAPRPLFSARVPDVYRVIAADPRPVRVLNLPFGLRDGLSSHGNYTAASQFYQTVHGKPLLGGYLSRLPRGDVARYRTLRVVGVLMDLSEGKRVEPERLDLAIRRAHERRSFYNIGYVVFERSRTPSELMSFAMAAFDLQYVTRDGDFELYRVPVSDSPPPER